MHSAHLCKLEINPYSQNISTNVIFILFYLFHFMTTFIQILIIYQLLFLKFSIYYSYQLFNRQNQIMQTYKTILKLYGPTKIKDGLFMGDQLAAHDLQWITLNHITHIINCVGKQVKNLYEKQGILYLTFPWTEAQTQVLFDSKDIHIKEIMKFIQEAVNIGGSVLIHSKTNDSRSCCILSAYLMKRFGWNLLKTLQFLNSRKEDIQLEPQFFQQLNNLQNRLIKSGQIKSENWNQESLQIEQLIIRNTFINSKQNPIDDPYFTKNIINKSNKKKKIAWKDKQNKNSKLCVEFKYNTQDKISNSNLILCKKNRIQSILKGSIKIIDFINNQNKQKPITQSLQIKQSRKKSSKSILQKDTKRKILESLANSNNIQNINSKFQI